MPQIRKIPTSGYRDMGPDRWTDGQTHTQDQLLDSPLVPKNWQVDNYIYLHTFVAGNSITQYFT